MLALQCRVGEAAVVVKDVVVNRMMMGQHTDGVTLLRASHASRLVVPEPGKEEERCVEARGALARGTVMSAQVPVATRKKECGARLKKCCRWDVADAAAAAAAAARTLELLAGLCCTTLVSSS